MPEQEKMLGALDRRLQYGPGLRVQRVAEASFLLLAFFTGDVRFAYVTLGLAILQVISPRLAPVGLLAASVVTGRKGHAVGDLYFDLAGSRGAAATATVVITGGIALVHAGLRAAGFLVLALPTASLTLAPAVGFCCGCTIYVLIREAFARTGLVTRYPDGTCDVDVDREEAARGHQR